jgi:hypothetical protein
MTHIGGPNNTWVLVHNYVGYVTVGFLVVQTVLGICTYFRRKVEGQRIPAFPDRIHCASSLAPATTTG